MTTYLGAKHWKPGVLQDLVFLQRGFDITKAQQRAGDVPVFSSAGLSSWHDKAMAQGPGVIIGRKGTLGSVHYSEGDYWPHDTTLWSKSLRGNSARYVYYALKCLGLERFNVGGANPTLNRNHIHDLPIYIPEPRLQNNIVSILSAYDNLIENNQRRIALLEEAARLLYREWFVHLRFPGHEHLKIIDGLPEGWERRTLGVVAENYDRKRVPLSVLDRDQRRGGFPYYGAAGILDYIDDYLFNGRYLLMGEDGTVITERGTPLLQLVEGKFWVNNHAHVLWGKDLSTEHLYCALNEYKIQGHVTGVAQPKITQKSMNRIPITVAPDNLRREFQDIVSPLFAQGFALETQNKCLHRARDLLLPRLMSGEIAV